MRKLLLTLLLPIASTPLFAQVPSVDLAQPITEAHVPFQTGRSAHQMEMYLAPVRDWQQRAITSLAVSGDIASDFRLIGDGAEISLEGRDVPGEYLRAMQAERLTRLLDAGPTQKPRTESLLLARASVARIVESRDDMKSLRTQAQVEGAIARYLLYSDLDETRASLLRAAETGEGDWKGKAGALHAALTEPVTDAHLEAACELMDATAQFRSRFAMPGPALAVLNKCALSGGVSAWSQSEGSDRGLRLRTLAQAAFLMSDKQVRSGVEAELERAATLSPEDQAELWFWIGASFMAQGMESEAITRFRRGQMLPADSAYPAYCSVRIMDCRVSQRKYQDAANEALFILDEFGNTPEVVKHANDMLDYLANARFLNIETAIASYEKTRGKQSRADVRSEVIAR